MNLKLIAATGLFLLCTQVQADTAEPATQGQNNPAMAQQDSSSQIMTNKQQGETFLQKNKTKPGVVTLADGLQYKIIQPGKGIKPDATDMVTVEYTGTFIDGKEFDSSSKQGSTGTIDFPVNQVIPGWVEALQLMPVGSVWEIYVPASLAYGDQGSPPVIGPGQTLIFKIKLVKVKKA